MLGKKKRILAEGKKRNYIETFIPHVSEALKELLEFGEDNKEELQIKLKEMLEQTRGKLEKIGIDNPDYDEDIKKIGKDESGQQ